MQKVFCVNNKWNLEADVEGDFVTITDSDSNQKVTLHKEDLEWLRKNW